MLVIFLLSSCASTSESKLSNYTVPPPSYIQTVANPLDAISIGEWSMIFAPVLQDLESLEDTYREIYVSSISTKLLVKSTELLNAGDTNRGARLALKGAVLSKVVNSYANISAFESRGFTQEKLHLSLSNLASVIRLKSISRELTKISEKMAKDSATKAEDMRIARLTPRNKKPSIHSIEALDTYLSNMMKGGSLSSYWCEKTKILSSSLFSPRSYKIQSSKSEDIYSSQINAYSNSYNVIIESSNQGGSPIIKTWTIYMYYSELAIQRGKVDWCIASLSS